MPANRKGWLSEVCTSPHHRARQSTSTRVSGLSKATSRRPSYAGTVPVGGPSPGERQRAAPGWRGAAGREELYRLPHDVTHARPPPWHQSQISPPIQEAGPEGRRTRASRLAGARAPVWNEMLSVLRSDWNGPALKVGKPTFLTCVHHPVFPFKEPEPEEYEF